MLFRLLTSPIDSECKREVIKIAIVDGVLYIKGRNKLYNFLQDNSELTVLSALVLREYLYSL